MNDANHAYHEQYQPALENNVEPLHVAPESSPSAPGSAALVGSIWVGRLDENAGKRVLLESAGAGNKLRAVDLATGRRSSLLLATLLARYVPEVEATSPTPAAPLESSPAAMPAAPVEPAVELAPVPRPSLAGVDVGALALDQLDRLKAAGVLDERGWLDRRSVILRDHFGVDLASAPVVTYASTT